MKRPAASQPWPFTLLAIAAWLASPAAWAQQLEPRAFAPNPTGASLVSLSAGRMEGDVLLDPAAPIEDFEAEVVTVTAGYARTFAIGERFASFGMAVPYASLDATGLVNGEPRRIIINYKNAPGQPQFRGDFIGWSLGSDAPADTFAFSPPEGAELIPMVVRAPPKGSLPAQQGGQ